MENTSESTNKSIKQELLPILIVNFIGTLGFSLVIPFLAPLVSKLGGNAVVYSLISAIYPAFQLIGGPIIGNLSDKYGRKPTLLASQTGTLISWIIFFVALIIPVTTINKFDSEILGTFTLTLPLIVISIARALDGLTGGNIAVTQAYVSDISDEENRNKSFGKLSISSNLGFIIGPALAGLLGATYLEEKLPTLAAILISLVATLLIIFKLKESKVAKSEAKKDSEKKSKLKNAKIVIFILSLLLLMYIAYNIFYSTFPIHSVEKLNWDSTELGVYFAFLSFVMMIIQGPVLSFLSDRIDERILIITGNIFMILCFILLTSSNIILLYLAAISFAIGNGVMWPSFLSVLTKTAHKSQQGRVQGLSTSVSSVASIVGLIFGGFVYVRISEKVFYISATLFGLVAIFSILLFSIKLNKKKT